MQAGDEDAHDGVVGPQSQNIDFPKSSKGYGRLYRKSYLDGLNILDGTCEIGGLLPLGRQQHLLNGEYDQLPSFTVSSMCFRLSHFVLVIAGFYVMRTSETVHSRYSPRPICRYVLGSLFLMVLEMVIKLVPLCRMSLLMRSTFEGELTGSFVGEMHSTNGCCFNHQ